MTCKLNHNHKSVEADPKQIDRMSTIIVMNPDHKTGALSVKFVDKCTGEDYWYVFTPSEVQAASNLRRVIE